MRRRFRSPSLTGALLVACALAVAGVSGLRAQGITQKRNYIRVDQFGYLPDAPKVAVIADAVAGFNAAYGIDLDAGADVTLRRDGDGTVVKAARATPWNGGATDASAGDRGWWFDFSDVTAAGTYYVEVTERGGARVTSNRFRIGDDVYAVVLKRAMQMFYYQRADLAKTGAYASGAPWTDGAWFAGPNQDRDATNIEDPSERRDVSGGWIDAGDPNKYVTFASEVVHNLLTSYDQRPGLWNALSLDLPESGDAVPDLLDEVNYEMRWLRRMQRPDGRVHLKAGVTTDDYISPPSTDTRTRYYEETCPSAAVTAAGMFAHAAYTYRAAGVLAADADDYAARAERAWDAYQASGDKAAECDQQAIKAGDADGVFDGYWGGPSFGAGHVGKAAASAVYLYALTGQTEYHDYFKANYTQLRPYHANLNEWASYGAEEGEALLFYTQLPGADPAIRDAILAYKTSPDKSSGRFYSVEEAASLYRAPSVYLLWGSNGHISRSGYANFDFIRYGLNPGRHGDYYARASAVANYLHGVNPFGMTYLSNMYADGGDYCADEMWHTWFKPGSPFDNIDGANVGPAPGFLSGGAMTQGYPLGMKIGTTAFPGENANAQPPLKRFSVNNSPDGGGQPWAYNEPAIYYQSAYVRLLANLVPEAPAQQPDPEPAYGDLIVATNPPGVVTQGETVGIEVRYEASAAREIEVRFEVDELPYDKYEVVRVPVPRGVGTVTIPVTVPDYTPVAADEYQFQTFLTPVGGGWTDRLSNRSREDVDVVAAVTYATVDVFAEGFANGWGNWSWGGTADEFDGLTVSGQRAFKYDLPGRGAVSFGGGQQYGSNLVALEFWARTWTGDADVEVSGSYTTSYADRSAPRRITVTPTYRKFTITKAELGGFGDYERLFFEAEGTSLYFDDVRFVTASGGLAPRAGDPAEVAPEAYLSVAPNPARDVLELTYAFTGAPRADEVRVELFRTTGQLVHAARAATEDGRNGSALVDVRALGLAPGLYLARVSDRDGGRARSARVVVE